MSNQFGTFAHTSRWAADQDKTLLVLNGQVPVRDGRVCYAGESVAGTEAREAITFATRAKAVSVDGLPEAAVLSALGGPVSWTAPRGLLQMVQLVPETEDEVSAVCGVVSLLAWHQENKYSGIDGSLTELADGGKKRLRGGRSLHPRVDPVAIVLVASADGTRCLLGRQARYPAGMYTCVSGFVEHAESVESAAAREVTVGAPSSPPRRRPPAPRVPLALHRRTLSCLRLGLSSPTALRLRRRRRRASSARGSASSARSRGPSGGAAIAS